MQPTLQQVFAAAAAAEAAPPDACEAPGRHGSAAGEAATRASPTPLQSKENVPGAPAAALAPGKQPRRASPSAAAAAAASGPAARSGGPTKQQPSKSTQLFLDLGQRDFGASRCSVCGMMYARGHAEDEKLHKAFHNSTLATLKFQGWAKERVVLSQPSRGRLLLVLQSDAAPQLKKVQELCSFVERAHGMPLGWLLSAPRAQVFLFVSAQKRVVGLAVVEPLKQAYRVVAAGGGEQEADSSRQAAAAGSAPQKRQPLLWPGLQRSSGRRLLEQRGALSAGTSLLSDPSAFTPASTGGCSNSGVKADSCPNSLLLAAGAMQVEAAAAAADEGQAQTSQQRQQQGMPPPLPRVQPPQHQQDTSSGQAPQAAAAAAAASLLRAGGSSSGGGSRSLRVDRRKPLRAMLGVRMVWVLPEQRRKGLATQMLDAARCNMVPGYVVPCAQMAFSQPSGDGAALAAAFTGTKQFLVYGMD